MKILFLSAASNIHTVRWVNALSECGYKVYLISLYSHKESNDNINHSVTIYYLYNHGKLGYYTNAKRLKSLNDKLSPDVVNVHYASGYGTLARLAKLQNTILSVWGSDVYDFPFKNPLNMWTIQRNLSAATLIASTSNCMAAQTQKLVNKKLDITVTPFGVDINRFAPMKGKKVEGIFTVGVIKGLYKKYGIDTILEAFSIFVKRLPLKEGCNARIIICGTGPEEKKLKKLCSDLNIEDMVYWKGYIPNANIPQVMNEFDVFCLGSRLDSESFGVAAVEAMSCSLPVIATDVDGFKEVIEHNITGYIVPRNDAKAIASKILYLYNSPKVRLFLGENARKRVVKFYDWKNNVSQMENLYIRSMEIKTHGRNKIFSK